MKVKLSKSEYFMRYLIFYIKNVMTKFKIFQEILNEREFYLSVLKTSRQGLQEYDIKNRGPRLTLKHIRWICHIRSVF